MLSLSYQESSKNADINVGFGTVLDQDLSDTVIGKNFGVTPGLKTFGDDEKGSFLFYVEDVASSQRAARATKISNVLLVHFLKPVNNLIHTF